MEGNPTVVYIVNHIFVIELPRRQNQEGSITGIKVKFKGGKKIIYCIFWTIRCTRP